MNKISTWLWFGSEAEEAANYYVSIFKNAKITNISRAPEGGRIPGGSVLSVNFSIGNHDMATLNGNNGYCTFTPAHSFMVDCETEEEINTLWEELSGNERIMMPLGAYPFAEKFGWCADKFGVSWQLNLTKKTQKVTPHVMFVGENFGRCSEAMTLYTSLFDESEVRVNMKDPNGNVMIANVNLSGFDLSMNENNANHAFNLTEATSFSVLCETQEEIDRLWNELTADGGEEMMCFWLKDKFGVTWQIVPKQMGEMLSNPETAANVINAMMKMKKPILADLIAACNN